MKSMLQPDSATTVGILTALGVYAIYHQSMPSVADLRVSGSNDTAAEKARHSAAIKSAVLIGAVFVVARDINSYIISGAALIGLDIMYKHANEVNPQTQKVEAVSGGPVADMNVYPLPNYNEETG